MGGICGDTALVITFSLGACCQSQSKETGNFHLTKGQVEAPPTQRYGECGSVGVGEEGENFITFVLREDLPHKPMVMCGCVEETWVTSLYLEDNHWCVEVC